MKKAFFSILVFAVLSCSSAFGQKGVMIEWGFTSVTPKYMVYHTMPGYIFLSKFGTLYNDKSSIERFTFLSDIGGFVRLRKNRWAITSGLDMFAERFKFGNESQSLNFKSYTILLVRNGIRVQANTAFRILDLNGMHIYVGAGGNYDLFTYKRDLNPLNSLSVLSDKSSSSTNAVVVEQKTFMDDIFSIPRLELSGSLQFRINRNTLSFCYGIRDPSFNQVGRKEVLFNDATSLKLQWTAVLGYKIK